MYSLSKTALSEHENDVLSRNLLWISPSKQQASVSSIIRYINYFLIGFYPLSLVVEERFRVGVIKPAQFG